MSLAHQHSKIACLFLLLSASTASAELLFTNFDGDPFGGTLYTAGGPCEFASCFAIGDNFEADATWNVTGFTFYMVSQMDAVNVGSGVRFAVFNATGTQIVAPTNAAPTVTDTGIPIGGEYKLYKLEITSLAINLVPGEYQFRATNASINGQGVYPGYGTASAQSISPGFFQLTGSQSVEAVLSTAVTQRTEDWAFEVYGTTDTISEDGFESP